MDILNHWQMEEKNFAKDEILYVPQPYTKSVYEEIMTRIENREGIYGSMYAWMEPLKIRQGIESALVLAPEIPAKLEGAEVKFTTRFVDEAYEEAITSQMSYIDDFDLYENSSDFCWIKGEKIMEYTAFSGDKIFFKSQENHPFTPQILECLQLFSNRYKQGEQEFG